MKAIWSDMIFDIKECNETEDEATRRVGAQIRNSAIQVEDAIKGLDLKKALEILKEIKRDY
tara:strand:+ start:7505 stop:7687 length:183 start_codon:yes stop_codon:yes gene_type:complete